MHENFGIGNLRVGQKLLLRPLHEPRISHCCFIEGIEAWASRLCASQWPPRGRVYISVRLTYHIQTHFTAFKWASYMQVIIIIIDERSPLLKFSKAVPDAMIFMQIHHFHFFDLIGKSSLRFKCPHLPLFPSYNAIFHGNCVD